MIISRILKIESSTHNLLNVIPFFFIGHLLSALRIKNIFKHIFIVLLKKLFYYHKNTSYEIYLFNKFLSKILKV